MSIIIKVKNPEDKDSFERAVKKFKKICQRDGFIQEIRERRYYLKPSEKKKLKMEKNRRRRKF